MRRWNIKIASILCSMALLLCTGGCQRFSKDTYRKAKRFIENGNYTVYLYKDDEIHVGKLVDGIRTYYVYPFTAANEETIDTQVELTDAMLADNQVHEAEELALHLYMLKDLFAQDFAGGTIRETGIGTFYSPDFSLAQLLSNQLLSRTEGLDVYVALAPDGTVLNINMTKISQGTVLYEFEIANDERPSIRDFLPLK